MHHRRGSVVIAAAAGTVLLVLGTMVGFRVVPVDSSWFISALLAGAGVVLLTGAWRGGHVLRGRHRWTREAAALGLRYSESLGELALPGILFRGADHSIAANVVDARDTESPFLAGDLFGTYGTGTSTPRRIASTFIAIPMDHDVTNFVLVNAERSMVRKAGLVPRAGQQVVLEGDFQRSFSLYGPAGSGFEARVIFTPDLMSLLVDAGVGCDVEMTDGWIFVYGEAGRFGTSRSIASTRIAVDVVREKILSRIRVQAEPRTAAGTVTPDAFAADRVAARAARVRLRASASQILSSIVVAAIVLGSVVWMIAGRMPGWLAG
ncbi:hypothetical protein [Microbacterium sp. NPDC087665]|uniref:hypothetical protein n=1 Tax=Microbacterium sp. NPDC087665 TaxID=3364194 RepID=UPI00381C34F4